MFLRLYAAIHRSGAGQSGASRAVLGIPKTRVYRTPEMRVDSKHRNVGFLALSGRYPQVAFESASSHKRTVRPEGAEHQWRKVGQHDGQCDGRRSPPCERNADDQPGASPIMQSIRQWSVACAEVTSGE